MNSAIRMSQDEFNAICPSQFSVDWSGGGTYGNCYNDQMFSVAGSDPETLTAHLDFLEQYFPNCTVAAVRAIQRATVTDSDIERDYYGGSITRYYVRISREKMQEILEEHGILEIEE